MNNVRNGRMRYAEPPRYLAVSHAAINKLTNNRYLSEDQFATSCRFATRLTPTGQFVRNVLRICSCPQVCGINASRNVTRM